MRRCRRLSFTRVTVLPAFAALALGSVACATKSDQPAGDTSSPATTSAGTGTSTDSAAGSTAGATSGMAGMSDSAHANMPGMAGSPGMANMTGNPDQDFLRMMSDHHKGLIAMAHLSAEEKKGSAGVQADAKKLDAKQDAELDSMTTMLEQQFKDPYAPKVMPDNQAMVDQLKGQTGAAFDHAFYQNVVMHHEQAIKMIDEFLPKLKRADIQQMAQRMRADQTREIAEFRKKADAAR